MTEKVPIWCSNNAVYIATLISPGKPGHTLLVQPVAVKKGGVDWAGREKEFFKKLATHVLKEFVDPIRKRKLGPKLAAAIKKIDRAIVERMYPLVVSTWTKCRPAKTAYIDVTMCRIDQFYPPT